jgi:hypothetical protein
LPISMSLIIQLGAASDVTGRALMVAAGRVCAANLLVGRPFHFGSSAPASVGHAEAGSRFAGASNSTDRPLLVTCPVWHNHGGLAALGKPPFLAPTRSLAHLHTCIGGRIVRIPCLSYFG